MYKKHRSEIEWAKSAGKDLINLSDEGMLINENSTHKPPKERKSARNQLQKRVNGGSKKQPSNSASVPEFGTNRKEFGCSLNNL